MTKSRSDIIKTFFEDASTLKRLVRAYLQPSNRNIPISDTQVELLSTIKQLQPVSFKELAKRLYLTPGAVSQLVDHLMQQAYITRKIDQHDRRVQALSLTKNGLKILEDVDRQRQVLIAAVVSDLTTEELLLWSRVQQKMIARLQSHQANTGDKKL